MKNPGFKFEYFSKTIRYKDRYIETYEIGKGDKTVLSFPSFPHSGISYLWFLNHYSLDKVRFITFDLPGWIGDSENIFKGKQFDIEEYIKISKDVLMSYNVTKFSLLGYSFGTALAVRLTSEMPERVKKVVLVSPVIDGTCIQNTKEVLLVNFVKRFNLDGALRYHVLKQWHYYSPLLLSEGCPPNFVHLYSSLISQLDPKTLLESIYALFHLDWSKDLDCLIDKKCLIVSSKKETKLFRKQAEILRRKLNNLNSLYLHGQHADFLLNPQSDTVKEVVKFLIAD